MIEPKNTCDIPLPPNAVTAEFVPESLEEDGVA